MEYILIAVIVVSFIILNVLFAKYAKKSTTYYDIVNTRLCSANSKLKLFSESFLQNGTKIDK